MTKCTKCTGLYFDEWKIMKQKSYSEQQSFLKDSRKNCPHVNSSTDNVPKASPVDVPKASPVDVPKASPKPKSFLPDPLKINPETCLSGNMTAKDYHDFLMGRLND